MQIQQQAKDNGRLKPILLGETWTATLQLRFPSYWNSEEAAGVAGVSVSVSAISRRSGRALIY